MRKKDRTIQLVCIPEVFERLQAAGKRARQTPEGKTMTVGRMMSLAAPEMLVFIEQTLLPAMEGKLKGQRRRNSKEP